MRKYLVVIDMQNDFIDGSLGTDEAKQIVPNVVDKIKNNTYYDIITTMDTHFLDEYPMTLEGKKLHINHCIIGTEGHNIQKDVYNALADKKAKFFTKKTFGSVSLAKYLPQSEIVAIDISNEALKIAKKNAIKICQLKFVDYVQIFVLYLVHSFSEHTCQM